MVNSLACHTLLSGPLPARLHRSDSSTPIYSDVPAQRFDPLCSVGTFPPLLLIHGWLGSAHDWHPIIDCISSFNHPPKRHIVAVDLPGHGDSPPWDDGTLTFSSLCDALASLITEQFTLTPPIIVGYSLGGRLALQLARRFPTIIHSLVMLAAHPGLPEDNETKIGKSPRAERRALDLARAHEVTTIPWPLFIEKWYELPVFSSLRTNPTIREQIINKRLAHPPAAPAPLLTALSLAHQPPPPKTLTIPTHQIVGSLDPIYQSLAHGAPWMNATSQHRITVIEGAGHAVMYEGAQEVAEVLAGW